MTIKEKKERKTGKKRTKRTKSERLQVSWFCFCVLFLPCLFVTVAFKKKKCKKKKKNKKINKNIKNICAWFP
jgi:hypothetical protein